MPIEPRAVDGGEVYAEESQDELQEVEDGDAAGGGDDAEAQLVGDLDEAGAIGDQHGDQRTEGERDCLNGDAMEAHFHQRRNAAQHQAFQQRVDGRGYAGPFLLEDGDHGDDESTDAAHHRRQRTDAIASSGEVASAPKKRFQVQAAVATHRIISIPVLLTAPDMVMVSAP